MSTGGSTSNGEERSAKTTEYVNFRSGPGTNYSSKGVIALGTTVTVTDTSNAQWYAVRLSNGSTGYIFAEYISFTGSNTPSATAAPTQAPSNGSEQSAKTTEYVNFRSGPGTNYSSKGVIALGTTVTVTDTSNSEVVRRAPLERLYGLHICAIFEAEQFFLRNGNARADTGAIQRFRADRKNDGIRKLPFRPRYELQF